MSTYCIGDVQGCYQELQQLLILIQFNPSRDTLWFVGDLVNRGPNSLEVLRFVANLPNKVVVLGNHDLHLLNYYYHVVDFEVSHLDQILAAPDAQELITWLKKQPLIHYDKNLDYVLVHAGIYPEWNLAAALLYAHEVEKVLQGADCLSFLQHMYGNQPDKWDENLSNWERLRFIVNAFTRMRYCTTDSRLDFTNDTLDLNRASELLPWYQCPQRQTKRQKIIFGHWAALRGVVNAPNLFALDTGCVWGGSLTAMRLEDQQRFAVASH
jgi:bis(5'-nucleosyl)-tetraphosphatase (symmetrical)